jgi:hypothetical protein
MPDRTAQTNPGLSLPDDLVLALNLSRTDRAVLNTIAAHRWTFNDDAQAWQGAMMTLGAEPPRPTTTLDDLHVLAACLRSPKARRTMHKLQLHAAIPASLMFSAYLPCVLVESLCGIARIKPFAAEVLPRARGWIATAAATRLDDPAEALRIAAAQAVRDATQTIYAQMRDFRGDLRDLHTTLGHHLAAIDWIEQEPEAGQ